MDSGRVDPRLIDLADRFLDGDLSPEAEAEFEARLDVDPDLRDALVIALSVRGLVGMALKTEEAGQIEEACQGARILIPGYVRGTNEAAQIAELSRHLESCPGCTVYYEDYRTSVGRRKVRRNLVFSVLALVGATACAWLILPSLISRPETPATVTWPELPIPSDRLGNLVDLIRVRGPAADGEGTSEAVELVRSAEPGFLREQMSRGPIAETLRWLIPSGAMESAAAQEATLLLAVLHDRRLNPSQRREVLVALEGRVANSRDLCWNLIETAEEDLAREGLLRMRKGGVTEEECRRLRRSLDRFIEMGSERCVELLAATLADAGDPGAAELCIGLLLGDRGSFEAGGFPDVAGSLARCNPRPSGGYNLDSLRSVVDSGKLSIGRALACNSLWGLTQDSTWHGRLTALADDPDVRVRRVVIDHLADHRDPEDQSIIQRLKNDRDPWVSRTALRLMASGPK